MPKIPTIQADESPNAPYVGRPITAQEEGAGSAEALASLGSSINNAILKLGGIQNEVNARQAITSAHKEINDYQQQLRTGPLNDGSQIDPKTNQPFPVGTPQIDQTTGLPIGPPPPEQHQELMQQKIDEVKQKWG